MNSLDKKGLAARKLNAEFSAEGATYNERRKQQTEKLREALTPVWTALKSGAVVNGQKGVEQWAKWFNPTAKYPERQLQRLMGEPKTEGETTSRHPKAVKLTEGLVLNIGGKKFTIVTAPESADDMTKTKTPGHLRLSMIVTPLVEEPKKKEKFYSQKVDPSFLLMPAKPHKTHGLQPNGRTWCGKTPGETLAKDAKMSDEPTCRQCKNGFYMFKARHPNAPVSKDNIKHVAKEPAPVVVAMTRAQEREVRLVDETHFLVSQGRGGASLRFSADGYQEEAKALVEALEERIEAIHAEHEKWVKENNISGDLLNWNNKSDEALIAKLRKSNYQGALKACEGAINKIISGDLESDGHEGRDLYDWSNARDEAKWQAQRKASEEREAEYQASQQLSEPAKALAAAVDGAVVPKICDEEAL